MAEKVDILIGNVNLKIGELTINDDGTLDGFLFENPSRIVSRILTEMPGSLSFSVSTTRPIPLEVFADPKDGKNGDSDLHRDH